MIIKRLLGDNWVALKDTSKKLLTYWDDSLALSESLDKPSDKYGHFLTMQEIQQGSLANSTREKLIADAQKETRGQKLSFPLDLFLTPLVLSPLEKTASGKRRPALDPLWLSAKMNEDGTLVPGDAVATIIRDYLDPSITGGITFGSLLDMTSILTQKEEAARPENWAEYWQEAQEVWSKVTGAALEDFRVDENKFEHFSPTVRLGTVKPSMIKQIRSLYHKVLNQAALPGALSPLVDGVFHEKRLAKKWQSTNHSHQRHLGQMGSEFGLNIEQRDAVEATLSLSEGDILAINGPPGTGKTSLIQSIVASHYVAHAVKGAEPPVLLACSSNNQAIVNILNSFASAEMSQGDYSPTLINRWLPNAPRFGLYLSSNEISNSDETPFNAAPQYNSKPWQGLPELIDNEAYLEKAKSFYCENFKAAYPDMSCSYPDEMVAFLHNVLCQNVAQLEKHFGATAKAKRKPSFLSKLFGASSPKAEQPLPDSYLVVKSILAGKEDGEEISNEEIDTKIRSFLFSIAARYWEGRWIIELSEKLQSHHGEKALYEKTRSTWHRFAMLSPCFIATFHSAPNYKYFVEEVAGKMSPLFNFIDLLIVDESGQVPCEIAAPTFALAKRAVVVGDNKQIPPIWNLTEEMDKKQIQNHGLKASFIDAAGANCSDGRLMSVARHVSKFDCNHERGMFLADHWRCHPTIISYCNEKFYGGRLNPKRQKSQQGFLPAMGFAHVEAQSAKENKSRINSIEAHVLVDWLKRNAQKICSQYSSAELHDAVAIVTPFSSQARLISEYLSIAGLGNEITVGTVHSLQGAEKKIVIFSSVYGSNDINSSLFFDRDSSILNVAVSRAIDSFIVFGHMGNFNASNTAKASGLLARYLFASPENEITDVKPAFIIQNKPAKEQVERIDNLEGHRKILSDAITKAKNQLLIVSPFLSHNALRADAIVEKITQAMARGVKVVIICDSRLNGKIKDGDEMYPHARKALEMLESTGVPLEIKQGVHNKTIAIDDSEIIEGSFNWLSASRDASSVHLRHEVSIRYHGPKAKQFIAKAWQLSKDQTPTEQDVQPLDRTEASPIQEEPAPRLTKAAPAPVIASAPTPALQEAKTLIEALKQYRMQVKGSKPAYTVVPDKVLHEMIKHHPKNLEELAQIKGIGPAKLDMYGDGFLKVLNRF